MCKAFEDHYQSGVRAGLREGEQQGEQRMIALYQCLIKSGRENELPKVMSDGEYRSRLFREYCL